MTGPSTASAARVLVADGDPSSAELLVLVLRQTGFDDVRSTSDPVEAVELCAAWQPDAILLDLAMGSAGEGAVLERLARFTGGERGVPVLALSADRDPSARRRAMALGARDFLTKPFDVAEVLVRVRNQLENRHLRQRLDALLPDAPEPAPPVASTPDMLSLQEAADTLGVSASTLRRWADGGRIPFQRTRGGHRRFTPDALRAFKARASTRRGPAVRPVGPPEQPMPTVARVLERDGAAILGASLRALYRSDQPGWFAGAEADGPTRRWLTDVATGARRGEYGPAITGTRSLEKHAAIGGASLLECHQFLGVFHSALVQVLARRGADRDETSAAHRLMACFEQRLLEEYGTEPAAARLSL